MCFAMTLSPLAIAGAPLQRSGFNVIDTMTDALLSQHACSLEDARHGTLETYVFRRHQQSMALSASWEEIFGQPQVLEQGSRYYPRACSSCASSSESDAMHLLPLFRIRAAVFGALYSLICTQ